MALSDAIRAATDAAAGHTAAVPAALVALREFLSGGSMDQLRQVIGLSHSGAVRLIDRLVADGLVERRAGSDGRSVALVLTPEGQAAASKVQAARAAAVEEVLGCLAEDERGCLGPVADHLLSALTEHRLVDRARGNIPSGGWLCRLCDFSACGRSLGACPAATVAQR